MTSSHDFQLVNPVQATLLSNRSCPYCGGSIESPTSIKEHVIGRRFVPKGKLNRSWNLIVRACTACNVRKSDLEDDISAITLQPNAWGERAEDDDFVATEGARKARNSISRQTGKQVGASQESLSVNAVSTPGLSISFDLVAPPQVQPPRAFKLAHLQLSALFYWISYNAFTSLGGFWPGRFYPIHCTSRRDWGNDLHVSFIRSVLSWDPRLIAIAADGYFKAVIRRDPNSDTWAWALEWNRNYRVIGMFGDEGHAQRFADTLPAPVSKFAGHGQRGILTYREEIPIRASDDLLFTVGCNNNPS